MAYANDSDQVLKASKRCRLSDWEADVYLFFDIVVMNTVGANWDAIGSSVLGTSQNLSRDTCKWNNVMIPFIVYHPQGRLHWLMPPKIL